VLSGSAPDATRVAAAFGLGSPLGPVQHLGSGWGGHNVLWRLTTRDGCWAIKQVRREIGPDPDAALAIELAAYAGGVPMPRPVPILDGACFAVIEGGRYRCHAWVDGTTLAWHGHPPELVARVGGLLAGIHRLRLGWSPTLAPAMPVFGADHWAGLVEQSRAANCHWSAALERSLAGIAHLEAMLSVTWTLDGAIGSHRDLHPTNFMHLATGALVLVDWDAAGPVVPEQEVACFALVFGDRGDRQGYEEPVVRAFIDGYRQAGGRFAFSGLGDLTMHAQGQLWWIDHNLRLALASPASVEQNRLTGVLLDGLSSLDDRLAEMAAIVARCA